MNIVTNSEQETRKVGKEFATKLCGGDVVLLCGKLGAGKTAFVKGIAQMFGIKNDITSPSFTLMNIYPIDSQQQNAKQLVHIDTYRLENEKELIDIGIEDYLGQDDCVCVVEWPEKMEKLLENKKTITVNIEHLDNEKRKISIG